MPGEIKFFCSDDAKRKITIGNDVVDAFVYRLNT